MQKFQKGHSKTTFFIPHMSFVEIKFNGIKVRSIGKKFINVYRVSAFSPPPVLRGESSQSFVAVDGPLPQVVGNNATERRQEAIAGIVTVHGEKRSVLTKRARATR